MVGVPRRSRYSGEANRPRLESPSFRATSDESRSGDARIARSNPSATRSTTRDTSDTSKSTFGYFALKLATTPARSACPTSAGAVIRIVPRGSASMSTTSALASETLATAPRTRS